MTFQGDIDSLDPTLNAGQSGHLADHEALARIAAALPAKYDAKLDVTTASAAYVPFAMPEAYGALGDNATDDAAAFASMFAALADRPVHLTPGKVYRIQSTVDVPSGAQVFGYGATIDAWDDGTSTGIMFRLNEASRVAIHGVKFTASNAAARTQLYGPLAIFGGSDIRLVDVEVASSPGVAIYAERVQRLVVERPVLHDTWADGLHVCRGAKDITVISPLVYAVLDDAIAFVSYTSTGGTVHEQMERIVVSDPIVRDITAASAAGVAFVGVKDATLTGGSITNMTGASSAGVKVVDDTGVGTHTPTDVLVTGTVVRNAHAGFRAGTSVDVTFASVTSVDCRDTAAEVIGATNPIFMACRLINSAAFGIFNDTSTTANAVGCDLRGNATAATGGTATTLTSCLT